MRRERGEDCRARGAYHGPSPARLTRALGRTGVDRNVFRSLRCSVDSMRRRLNRLFLAAGSKVQEEMVSPSHDDQSRRDFRDDVCISRVTVAAVVVCCTVFRGSAIRLLGIALSGTSMWVLRKDFTAGQSHHGPKLLQQVRREALVSDPGHS